MSEYNSQNNRAVWFDISVADLDRSIRFYSAVLAVEVSKEQMGDFSMGVLHHRDGNGGCLVVNEAGISSSAGILVYMNTNGRIRDAVEKTESLGGKIQEPIHAIGPHGFRAIVLDSEGNRIALHSCSDQ